MIKAKYFLCFSSNKKVSQKNTNSPLPWCEKSCYLCKRVLWKKQFMYLLAALFIIHRWIVHCPQGLICLHLFVVNLDCPKASASREIVFHDAFKCIRICIRIHHEGIKKPNSLVAGLSNIYLQSTCYITTTFKCSRVLWSALECSGVLWSALECSTVLQSTPKCSKVFQSAEKCLKCSRVLKSTPKCSRMLQNAPKSSKVLKEVRILKLQLDRPILFMDGLKFFHQKFGERPCRDWNDWYISPIPSMSVL